MRRVLISGGTGFVGANLARWLVRDGHEVHLLVRPESRLWRVEGMKAELRLHEADLADPESLAKVVAAARPEWIFHLAVYGAYPTQTELASMVRTNVSGTMNLVEACLAPGFEAFVNTGSSSEYGFRACAPPETARLEPNSQYAVTKAAATMFCRFTAQSRRVHLPTLRLYSVYGPYEEPTRLLPTLVVRGLQGELPPLVSPDVARDYVYVDDVVEAYLLAAQHPGGDFGAVYNVGSGVQTTLREVVAVARRVLSIAVEPDWGSMPGRGWDTDAWVADNRKIREGLGWQPRHSLEQGFRRLVDWFRACPGRPAAYRELRRGTR